MLYSNRLLQVYSENFNQNNEHNTNNETNENRDPNEEISNKIAQSAKDEYENMYDQVLASPSRINEFIERNYIEPILENDVSELIKENSEGIIRYRDLITMLKADCRSEQDDNFEELAKVLQSVKAKKKLEKASLNLEKFFDKEKIDKAINDSSYLDSHWFPKHVNNIINIINIINIKKPKKQKKSENKLQEEIVHMIYIAFSKDDFSEGWFQLTIDIFKTYIPNFWNNCVYTWCLIDHHKLLRRGKKETANTKITLGTCKNAYKLIMNHAIVACISSHFSNEKKENSSFKINDITFPDIKNYFCNGGNFKGKFAKQLKRSTPREKFTEIVYHVGMVLFLTVLYKKLQDREEKSKAQSFIEDIALERTRINWSVAKNCLSEPSKSEREFLNALKVALKTKNAQSKLLLFTNTETELIKSDKDKSVQKIISDIRNLRNRQQNMPAPKKKLLPLLRQLVLACDNISVDFEQVDFRVKFRNNYDDIHYILHCLSNYEKSFLNLIQNDVFYMHDASKKNYDTLKSALKYRFRNLNASIFDIYKDVVEAIESHYSSSDCSEKEEHTERDLLFELNDYAWYTLQSELNIHSEIPGTHAPADPPAIVHTKFFRACDILDEQGKFKSADGFLACAAMGLVEGNDYTAKEIAEILLTILEKYCCSKSNSACDHLELYSKEYLVFASIVILALHPLPKKLVVNQLCENAKTVLIAKKRESQQTLILLLNTLLIQPKARFDSETAKKILDTIYNRVLYPQQMLSIGRIEQHSFLKAVLSKQKALLSAPQIINDQFPSPFYLYLYANEFTAEVRTDPEKCKFLEEKENTVSLNKSFSVGSIADFYKVSILLQGLSWRIVNTDPEAKVTKIDPRIFTEMINLCSAWWSSVADFTKADDDLLMLTWGSQLLLTAWSNLMKEGKFFNAKAEWDQKDLLEIALYADYTQRLFNEGYARFLEKATADTETETETETHSYRPDFWLVSGAHRYTSVLETIISKPEKLEFFKEKEKATQKYHQILMAEKRLPSTYRFYILTSRLLSYTDFFDVVEDRESIDPALQQFPADSADLFLVYDNIKPYLTRIGKDN